VCVCVCVSVGQVVCVHDQIPLFHVLIRPPPLQLVPVAVPLRYGVRESRLWCKKVIVMALANLRCENVMVMALSWR
jgi:hypothetical protein